MEMTNLVDEFFKRNLTETESENLEELLEKSPEASASFGEKLRLEYLSFGLPQPQIPKNFHPPVSVPSPFWLGPLLGLSALAGLATAAWWMWPRSTPPMQALTTAPLEKPAEAPVPKNTDALPPPPIEIPQKLGADSREGNRLSVVVELEKMARVQVRVLNPDERPLRVLFEGPLSPGKWAIQWDGLLADGSKAGSGKYLIEVKSGSQAMTQSVSVEPPK